MNNPWDLHTGIQANSIVKPGDTIWVRGGTYAYSVPWQFQVNLTGTSVAPIVIRRFPGEWAVFDLLDNGDEFVMDHAGRVSGTDSNGNPVTAVNNSDYVWLWGLEITATGIPRATSNSGSFGIGAIVDVAIYGVGVKLINCYVHDMHDFGFWATSAGSEINGTLIGNIGWNAPDRGHGHNLYVQNDGLGGSKSINNVFLYNSFDIGMQWYGSDTALVQNIAADGATIVNSGAPAGAGAGQLVIAGGGSSKKNLKYTDGWSFVSPSLPGGFSEIGWVFDGINQNVDIENNFWGTALSIEHWNQLTFLNNTVQGGLTLENYDGSSPVQPRSGWTLDSNVYTTGTTFTLGGSHLDSNGKPVASDTGLSFAQWAASLSGQESHSTSNVTPSQRVVVQPNSYEPGRANIIIYNPQSSPTVAVDISQAKGLNEGDHWELHDGLNFRGAPVLAGTYSKSNTIIQVPMTGLSAAQVVGWSGAVPHTAPLFGYFIFLGGAAYDPSISIQPACAYATNVGGQTFTATGGNGIIRISAPEGCVWSELGAPSWVAFTSSLSGIGNGMLSYQVMSNTGPSRAATLSVAGISFTIEQSAVSIPNLNFIGSMAHLAAEENWTTAFTLVNKDMAQTTARVSFFGDPSGTLTLPLGFPQVLPASQPVLAASLDRTINANGSLVITTAGSQTPPVLVGSAQLAATGSVDGFAIFHQIVTAQEAVVPMETRIAGSYLLAFDNTEGVTLGVAVENVSAQVATIPVIIRDDNGNIVAESSSAISLGGNGHTSFVLSTQYPNTADKRGTIEFDTPPGGQISVLGLRFTPPNNALTTIPALANVGTGGGSIAHLASGGDGWQTTFVLVNTGNSATSATLKFYADVTGNPLPLPLSFPQTGDGATMLVPSYTAQLTAGASLVIRSSNDGQPLLTGSAQLTTTGNVTGFVIFRHNGQEAVVLLESRNASAYVMAFDNTNGTATGIALNAVSAGQVNIPVTVRDDTGAQIATDTITLAANGHYAFTLGSDRYPAAAAIRGTIEFDKPAGAQIGALAIRIPAVAAHTYTTLPALAK